MILEHFALVPFGPMRPGNQAALGSSLADLHLTTVRLLACTERVIISLCGKWSLACAARVDYFFFRVNQLWVEIPKYFWQRCCAQRIYLISA